MDVLLRPPRPPRRRCTVTFFNIPGRLEPYFDPIRRSREASFSRRDALSRFRNTGTPPGADCPGISRAPGGSRPFETRRINAHSAHCLGSPSKLRPPRSRRQEGKAPTARKGPNRLPPRRLAPENHSDRRPQKSIAPRSDVESCRNLASCSVNSEFSAFSLCPSAFSQ